MNMYWLKGCVNIDLEGFITAIRVGSILKRFMKSRYIFVFKLVDHIRG